LWGIIQKAKRKTGRGGHGSNKLFFQKGRKQSENRKFVTLSHDAEDAETKSRNYLSSTKKKKKLKWGKKNGRHEHWLRRTRWGGVGPGDEIQSRPGGESLW